MSLSEDSVVFVAMHPNSKVKVAHSTDDCYHLRQAADPEEFIWGNLAEPKRHCSNCAATLPKDPEEYDTLAQKLKATDPAEVIEEGTS